MADKLEDLKALAIRIRDEVYVNPYSKEAGCMFEERKSDGGLCICFEEFYIALKPSGEWEMAEYDNLDDEEFNGNED